MLTVNYISEASNFIDSLMLSFMFSLMCASATSLVCDFKKKNSNNICSRLQLSADIKWHAFRNNRT